MRSCRTKQPPPEIISSESESSDVEQPPRKVLVRGIKRGPKQARVTAVNALRGASNHSMQARKTAAGTAAGSSKDAAQTLMDLANATPASYK
jgi:hypothetical protein